MNPKNILLVLSMVVLSCTVLSQAEERETFQFDFAKFKGERIVAQKIYSAKVGKLNLNLTLPPNYRLLIDAKPFIALFTEQHGLIDKFYLEGADLSQIIEKIMPESNFYIYLALYYCKDDELGLCLVKNILYEFSCEPDLPAGDINLEYPINDVY